MITMAQHACDTHNAYRLSCADYDGLVAKFAGLCWRCRLSAGEQIDHEHARGLAAVRGFLCRSCNTLMSRVDAGAWIDTQTAIYLRRAWHVGRSVPFVPDRRTTVRSVRVDDDLWEAAARVAARNRETIADVIRRALLAHAGDELEVTP